MSYCDVGKLSIAIEMNLFSQLNEVLQPELNYISINFCGFQLVTTRDKTTQWEINGMMAVTCLVNAWLTVPTAVNKSKYQNSEHHKKSLDE